MPHDSRDDLVDFVRSWSDKTDIAVSRFLPWIGIGTSKFHDWKQRFGQINEHNAWVPRDHWLTDDAIDDRPHESTQRWQAPSGLLPKSALRWVR